MAWRQYQSWTPVAGADGDLGLNAHSPYAEDTSYHGTTEPQFGDSYLRQNFSNGRSYEMDE